jgi:hypothetical protein
VKFSALLCKSSALALGIAMFAFAPSKLHATTFTYDLVLTDSSNPTYSGTGVVTITGPNALQTFTNYTATSADAVTGLSFVVDGNSFNMNDAGVNKSSIVVEFSTLNPTATIWDITFADTTGTSPNRLTLDSSGDYIFYYNNGQNSATGTFSAATLASATPEPGSIFLLGTGMLGAAGGLYRRIKLQRT